VTATKGAKHPTPHSSSPLQRPPRRQCCGLTWCLLSCWVGTCRASWSPRGSRPSYLRQCPCASQPRGAWPTLQHSGAAATPGSSRPVSAQCPCASQPQIEKGREHGLGTQVHSDAVEVDQQFVHLDHPGRGHGRHAECTTGRRSPEGSCFYPSCGGPAPAAQALWQHSLPTPCLPTPCPCALTQAAAAGGAAHLSGSSRGGGRRATPRLPCARAACAERGRNAGKSLAP